MFQILTWFIVIDKNAHLTNIAYDMIVIGK